MDYYLYPPFFGIEPQTSFDEAWEVFCCELLNLEHATIHIRRRSPPDLGADLIWESEHVIYQCKASETGKPGSLDLNKVRRSIERAKDNQEILGWHQYVFCTNVDLTGIQEHKLHEDLPNIKILSRAYWTKLCKKFHREVISHFRFTTLSPTAPVWNIPYRKNPFFTGREDVLKLLRDKLKSAKTAALTQPQAINGLGGIGKTQIALEYAYRFRDDYRAVLWVNAVTRESTIRDFINVAELLQLPEREGRDQNKAIVAVKHWFAAHDGWLLILDNADDLEIVGDFLHIADKGHILITTRAQATGSFADPFLVEKMGMNEGILLLLRRAKRLTPHAPLAKATTEDQSEAEAIVAALDGLPLAIDQAGAYIEETECQLSSYLSQYRQRQIELLKRRGMNVDHPEPVATTWSLSFERVEEMNPLAADLLRVFAFLNPDSIPEEMIVAGASKLGSPLQVIASNRLLLDEAIGILRRYSLIHRNRDDNSFTIHRLVQVVLKGAISKVKQRQWAKGIVQAVSQAFPDVSTETRMQCIRYLPQALTCADLIEQYQLAFPEAARLLHQAAFFLSDDASYIEAEPLYQQALTIYKRVLGPEDPNTATCLGNLALLYTRQGKFEQAEPLYQRALTIRERVLGADHPDTAYTLNNLALHYSDQGKFEQAELFYQRARTIFERTLGPDHPDVAITLDNLASLYIQQDKFEYAELLFQRAHTIFERTLGPGHLTTIVNLHNQASLYEKQGKFEQAEKLYQYVLTIREQTLGPEHPETAGILNNLAAFYLKWGKAEQAELLHFRALTIREQALGPDHPDTARSLNNLALNYHHQQKFEQAEQLYQRALTINEQVLGPEHLETAFNYNNLAGLYADQGKLELAEPLYLRALAIREQALGPDHSEIAFNYNNLAGLYADQGKLELAELLYLRALTILEKTSWANHPDTANCCQNLAILYDGQGKFEQAEPLYLRALAINEQTLGSNHPEIVESLHNIVGFYYKQGKFEQAKPLCQRILDIREQILGISHADTAQSLNNLAVVYTRLGDFELAESLFQRALAIDEQMLGFDHPNTLRIMQNYAGLLRNCQQEEQAAVLENRIKVAQTEL